MITLSTIINSVCEVCEISREQFINGRRTNTHNTAKGLYYLISSENGYAAEVIAREVGRARVTCVLTCKSYRGYLDVNDRYVMALYKKVKKLLKEREGEYNG